MAAAQGTRATRWVGDRGLARLGVVAPTLALLLAACTRGAPGGAQATSTPGAPAPAAGPIVFASVEGPVIEGGPDFTNGMKVVASLLNEGGGIAGRPVEVEVFRFKGGTETAVAAYKQAAQDPDVLGVFYSAVTGALAIRAQSEALRIPTVIATANDFVDRPVTRYVFKDSFAPEYATSSLVYAVEELGAREVAVLHYDTDYSVIIPDALQTRCQQLGCDITAVESASGIDPVDALTPQLSRLRATNPDVYYIEGLNPAAFAAARQLWIDEPIISEQWLAIPALRDACGENCDGVYFAIHKCNVIELVPADDPMRQLCETYRPAYEAQIGSWAGFSIYGADAVWVMAKAAENVLADGQDLTRESLVDAMEHLNGDVFTTHGTIYTSPQNHRLTGTWGEAYIMVQIQAGPDGVEWVLAPGADPRGSTP